MLAAQINDYGDISVITINNIEKPTIQDGQVLVEVHAASLNPFDTTVRAGYMKDVMPLHFPATLGGDFAGIITAVGSEVHSVHTGDKVYGQANVVGGASGAFAEFSAASAGQVALMPSNLDFKQSASLPLVGVSAYQALTDHIKLKSGQKVFIHGGAGGIGSVAIQIAKHIGAYIITTATGGNVDYVKQLGANEIIDYKLQDFTNEISDCDAVFDTVGGNDFNKSFALLKRGGIAVSMVAKANQAQANKQDITAMTQGTRVTTEALNALRELVETGVVTTRVDRVYPLEAIQEAFQARESGATRGKIVLTIR